MNINVLAAKKVHLYLSSFSSHKIRQRRVMNSMHNQGMHQVEKLEDIKKYLNQNGVNLKDISLSIEYEALRKLKTWINQEDKELAMDWDQFQECVTYMFEDYCNASREIHQKLDKCTEVCPSHPK